MHREMTFYFRRRSADKHSYLKVRWAVQSVWEVVRCEVAGFGSKLWYILVRRTEGSAVDHIFYNETGVIVSH